MRRLGHEVEFVPGWERRGAGTVTPRAKVNHHTAGSRRAGVAPSLRICTFGRPDLRNALCNTYSDRKARLYVVAAGVAWHAGLGSWRGVTGNSAALGHEAENDGVGEPWSDEHLLLLADLDRVQRDVFGYGVSMVCEHKEWSPGRKIDRAGINGSRWRERISKAEPRPHDDEPAPRPKPPRPQPPAPEQPAPPAPKPVPPAPAPAPRPKPVDDLERWLVSLPIVKKGDRGAGVRRVQSLLAANGHPPANTFDARGRPDGVAGDGFDEAVRRFQRERGLEADGVVGPNTWAKLLGVRR